MKTAMKLAFVIFWAILLLSSGSRANEWLDNFDDLTQEQRDALPDQHDPAVRAKLLCSACHWFVVELYGTVRDLQSRSKGKQPKQYVIDDTFEEFCPTICPKYGLHVDSETKLPKPKFTRLASQLQGGWMSRIFENECTDFVDAFQVDASRRKWSYLRSLWEKDGTIAEATFLKLCPICAKPEAAGGYPSREESLMWVDERTRVIEDWDL